MSLKGGSTAMRRKTVAAALVLLALALALAGCATPQAVAAPPERSAFDAPAIYEKAAPATWTVLVNTVDGWWAKGSAFSVDSPGSVLTAYHVVKDYKEFKLVDWDGDTTYRATVKRFDEKADLALLEIANPSATPFLSLAAQSPKVGEEVMLVGSPSVHPEEPKGYIPAVATVGRVGRAWAGRIVADITASAGESGGALLDANGRVVGLLLGILGPDPRIHTFASTSDLAAFLAGR
ncbi:MAG: serine protease [Pseudomonadota bacterium]